MVRKILEQEPITLGEVRDILTEELKDKSDIGYVQSRAVSHANKFTKLSLSESKKLVDELVQFGVNKEKAVEITNILPENIEELRIIFAKEKATETDKLEEILKILNKYDRQKI